MSTPPHQPPSPTEDRVGDWMLLWLRSEWTEERLARQLRTYVWGLGDITWTMWEALRGHLHAVLVQYREAAADHFEQEPPCGPSARSPLPACTATDVCGRHRDHLGSWFDTNSMFVGQVVTQVPIRAAASVEITMNGPNGG